MTLIHHPRRILAYIVLRPALLWSLISMIFFLALLFAVRWSSADAASSMEYVSLELVPVQLPRSVTVPDIAVSDNAERVTIEEKKPEDEPPRFGDDSGQFGDLSETSRAPMPIYSRLPEYPVSMRKAGIEGVVIIEIGVDESGTLVYGRGIRSLGREFDLAAMTWVRSIRFRPGLDREG
ncbi:MAG: hypothetical protein CVV27_22085, partial [Candidatus Melainabacteria bacterium HGW-Melainabacteria-1]